MGLRKTTKKIFGMIGLMLRYDLLHDAIVLCWSIPSTFSSLVFSLSSH